MSAPVARTTRPGGSTVQATRQQLDELDALLQRMLDLPVNQVEQEPPEPAPMPTRAMPPAEEPARPLRPARPTFSPGEPTSRPAPGRRGYPPSYMVVETASPPFASQQSPPAEADHGTGLGPRLLGNAEPPVPGGRHDLVEDAPEDEVGELARMRSQLENESPDAWVPLRSSWQPSAQTWKPLAETWEQARGTPPPPAAPVVPPSVPPVPTPVPQMPSPPVPTVIPPPPASEYGPPTTAWSPPPPSWSPVSPPQPPAASEMPPVPAPTAPVAVAPPPGHPVALLPLVWFNQAFDACLVPLGPLGHWLRGPAGRGFLGTLGLLALVAAAGLVAADGFGWTR